MPGHLIRSAMLIGAAELMRTHGVHPPSVTRAVGLPARALTDPHLLVPTVKVIRLFELAAERCALRTWSLELARHANLVTIIGPLWVLLRNARSVEQMCREFAENFDLFSDSAMLSLEPVVGGILFTWSLTNAQSDSEVQMSEFALALIVKEIRAQTSRDWAPEAVLFRHARPKGHLRLHREAFGADVRFSQDSNALFLSDASLKTPLRGRGAAARALAGRFARLEDEFLGRSIALKVETVIRALMPYGPCTIKNVSEALDMAPRTLQKHLKEGNGAFVTIRDAVRADLAAKYLRYSDMSITQIAEVLGYCDPTSFSRSFRRWNGRCPREVRRR